MRITRKPAAPGRLVQVLLAALLTIVPRPGGTAPAPKGPARTSAATAVALFEEGTVLEEAGYKKVAADRYRAAAEANAALHEAEERSSAAHETFVARAIKGYDAAFRLASDPALKQSASDWCTKLLADVTGDPTSVRVEEKCVQWGWQPPPEPPEPEPPEPPGPSDTTGTDGEDETETGSTTSGTGIEPPPPPPPSTPPKPWRGLAIAGGYTLGGGTVFLVLALAGAVRQVSIMREEGDCTEPYDEACAKLNKQGEALRPLSAASVTAGVLLTGTGAALLTIAMRRRAAQVAVAPALHPQFLGLTLRGRF